MVCRSPTSPATSSPTAEEEEEEGRGLSKQGRELQRLLKTTGLSESDNEDVRKQLVLYMGITDCGLRLTVFRCAVCTETCMMCQYHAAWLILMIVKRLVTLSKLLSPVTYAQLMLQLMPPV